MNRGEGSAFPCTGIVINAFGGMIQKKITIEQILQQKLLQPRVTEMLKLVEELDIRTDLRQFPTKQSPVTTGKTGTSLWRNPAGTTSGT